MHYSACLCENQVQKFRLYLLHGLRRYGRIIIKAFDLFMFCSAISPEFFNGAVHLQRQILALYWTFPRLLVEVVVGDLSRERTRFLQVLPQCVQQRDGTYVFLTQWNRLVEHTVGFITLLSARCLRNLINIPIIIVSHTYYWHGKVGWDKKKCCWPQTHYQVWVGNMEGYEEKMWKQ